MTTFLLTSCEKEPYKACKEDPTCEYLRCKVNGEWWTPDCEQGPLFGCDHTDVQYYKEDGYLSISSTSKKKDEGFYILALDVLSTGDYDLYDGVNVKTRFRRGSNIVDCWVYYIISGEASNITIDYLDNSNYVVGGSFLFKCKNDCGEILNITDGEFRQKYRF